MSDIVSSSGKGALRALGIVSLLLVVPAALAACSSAEGGKTNCDTDTTGTDGGAENTEAGGSVVPPLKPDTADGGNKPEGDGAAVVTDGGNKPEGDGAATDAAPGTGGFQPSNLPSGPFDVPDGAGDNVINNDCVLNTSDGTLGCPGTNDTFAFSFRMIEQPAGGQAALFVMKGLRIAQAARLRVEGGSPAIVYALDDIVVDGNISSVTVGQPAGGFPQDDTGHGGGPGGGESLLGYDAAGGGSYCGVGGKGGLVSDGTARAGGKVYGNPEIIPLIGGSSGGGGPTLDGSGGNGGAAIQLSAGRSITVSLSGVINVGGLGGRSNAGAGGSGGSLILEALSVAVHGTLAANGGGGALSNGGSSGQPGQPSASAAQGSAASAGIGSAGKTKNGGDGSWPAGNPPNDSGGGGGGAGRIRINSKGGVANLKNATLSPDLATECTTEGLIGG